MSNWKLVGTDKNGTKIYADNTCTRCGGRGGSEAWTFTGFTCYECGGSGKSTTHYHKEYTAEYKAKLEEMRAKREAKRQAKILEERLAQRDSINAKFMEDKFWSAEMIQVLMGDTYAVRYELKEEGCKFNENLGWYAKETSRKSIQIKISNLIALDEHGFYYIPNTVKEQINTAIANATPESNYVGEVGQRIEVLATVEKSIKIFGQKFSYYDSGVSYINVMRDDAGNVLIWKTDRELTGKLSLKGTIKEHKDYNGLKQTVLTRCKIL